MCVTKSEMPVGSANLHKQNGCVNNIYAQLCAKNEALPGFCMTPAPYRSSPIQEGKEFQMLFAKPHTEVQFSRKSAKSAPRRLNLQMALKFIHIGCMQPAKRLWFFREGPGRRPKGLSQQTTNFCSDVLTLQSTPFTLLKNSLVNFSYVPLLLFSIWMLTMIDR